MTNLQILFGLVLILCSVLRPLLYKPAAEYFPTYLSALFTSVWLMIGLIVSFPILGYLFTDNAKEIITSPYILLSILKGICLWLSIKLQQSVNKQSTSSSAFFSFMSLALASLINNLFFNEGLKPFQLICILGFGILGLEFFIYGDAKRLSNKNKIAFILAVIFGASFSIEDHLAIPKIGWYAHLLFSSIFMFLACFLNKITFNDIAIVFKNKTIVIAGIFYTLSEFIIVYCMINILPVSLASMFMRLSIPIVMIISAIRFKEQSIKNQLIFGFISFALALPLILIK